MSEPSAPETSGAKPSHTTSTTGIYANRQRGLRHALIGLAVATLAIAIYWFLFMYGIVFTDDARLAGTVTDVSPQVAGLLQTLKAHEGEWVKADETLFTLDDGLYRAAAERAEAALAVAEANLAVAEANRDKTENGSRPEEIRAAEAEAARLQAQFAQAESDWRRIRSLADSGVVTPAARDQAQTNLETARQSLARARENLDLLRHGARAEDKAAAMAAVAQARAQVTAARAALASAKLDLAHCTITAPFSGWVVRRWQEEGVMLAAGRPVLSVFDPASLRVDANIEERDLYRVAEGDRAELEIDGFPQLKLTGRVERMLRATNSQFSLIPSEGVSGTYIKVTQRVPLRLSAPFPQKLALGPGLSVEVWIRCGTGGEKPRP